MSQRSSLKSVKTSRRSTRKREREPLWASQSRTVSRQIPSTVSSVQVQQSATANRATRVLVYSDIHTFANGSVGVGDHYSFRANSIFDPDAQVGGHQPMGTDQWEAFYIHYRVKSSRITVTPVLDAASTTAVMYYVTLGAQTPGTDDAATAIERGRCAYKLLPAGNSGKTTDLVNEFDAKKFFGPTYLDADHKALFNSNPAEDVFFHVGFTPMNPSAGTDYASQFLLRIEYEVEFSEPKQLSQS